MLVLPVSLALSALLVVGGCSLAIAQRGWQADRRFHRLLVIATSLLLVSTAASGGIDSWVGLLNYLPFVLALALASQVLTSRQRIYRFALAIAAGSWLFSLMGLLQGIWGWHGRWSWLGGLVYGRLSDEHFPRPTSVFLSPNSMGIYLVLVLAVAWGVWRDRQSAIGVPNWLSAIIPVGAVAMGLPLLVLSESRNAWLLAMFMAALALTLHRCWRLLVGLAAATGVPVAAAANWWGLRVVVPQSIWQRLVDSVQPNSPSYISIVTRWEGWQLAASMIASKPLVGWGWQSFAQQWSSQEPQPTYPLTHAHNIYLSVTAEGGAVALLAFALIWGWPLWRGWRAWHLELRRGQSGHLILGVNFALTAYFLSGLLDAPLFDGRLNVVFWMLLAIANAYWLCLQEESFGSNTNMHLANR